LETRYLQKKKKKNNKSFVKKAPNIVNSKINKQTIKAFSFLTFFQTDKKHNGKIKVVRRIKGNANPSNASVQLIFKLVLKK